MTTQIYDKDIPTTICDAVQEMWEIYSRIARTDDPKIEEFMEAKDRVHQALSDMVAPGEEEVFLSVPHVSTEDLMS